VNSSAASAQSPPDAAIPLQRVQLLAARSVGSEIIQLRDTVRRLELEANLSTKYR
jgi:hypothetical protein